MLFFPIIQILLKQLKQTNRYGYSYIFNKYILNNKRDIEMKTASILTYQSYNELILSNDCVNCQCHYLNYLHLQFCLI